MVLQPGTIEIDRYDRHSVGDDRRSATLAVKKVQRMQYRLGQEWREFDEEAGQIPRLGWVLHSLHSYQLNLVKAQRALDTPGAAELVVDDLKEKRGHCIRMAVALGGNRRQIRACMPQLKHDEANALREAECAKPEMDYVDRLVAAGRPPMSPEVQAYSERLDAILAAIGHRFVDVAEYPQLKSVAGPERAALRLREEQAFRIYRHYWSQIDMDTMDDEERSLVQHLLDRHNDGQPPVPPS